MKRLAALIIAVLVGAGACDKDSPGAGEQRLSLEENLRADDDAVEIAEMESWDPPEPVVIGGEALARGEAVEDLGAGDADARALHVDADEDGIEAGLDCDDWNREISPRAIERFCDGRDQNCNGVDECDTDRDGAHDAYDLDPLDPAVGARHEAEIAPASD